MQIIENYCEELPVIYTSHRIKAKALQQKTKQEQQHQNNYHKNEYIFF